MRTRVPQRKNEPTPLQLSVSEGGVAAEGATRRACASGNLWRARHFRPSLNDPNQALQAMLQGGGLRTSLFPPDKAPTDIEFRGCKLGGGPAGNGKFPKKYQRDQGTSMTCWSIVATVTPLVLSDGTPLTDPSEIPKWKEAEVDKALVRQINGLKSDDGHPIKDCIEGLAKGETADRSLGKIKQIHFQNKGNVSATWASPDYNYNWQKGSMCVKDLTDKTSPCKIVTTSAPSASGGGEKKGAMTQRPSETQYAGDLVSTEEGERLA